MLENTQPTIARWARNGTATVKPGVDSYLEYLKTSDRRLFWAWEEVHARVKGDDVERSWTLVETLISAAEEPIVLAQVSAGPLEDLLREFGAELSERVILLVRRDAKFRKAIAGVWGLDRDQPELWEAVAPMLNIERADS